jgi:hypothetical protein
VCSSDLMKVVKIAIRGETYEMSKVWF